MNINKMEKFELFKGLPKEKVEELMNGSKEVTFSKWENIIRDWQKTNNKIYIITEWEIEIKMPTKTINILKPGDIVWELAFLTGKNKRTWNVFARSELKMVEIKKEAIAKLLGSENGQKLEEIVMQRIAMNQSLYKK